jgi:hypothetical protein
MPTTITTMSDAPTATESHCTDRFRPLHTDTYRSAPTDYNNKPLEETLQHQWRLEEQEAMIGCLEAQFIDLRALIALLPAQLIAAMNTATPTPTRTDTDPTDTDTDTDPARTDTDPTTTDTDTDPTPTDSDYASDCNSASDRISTEVLSLCLLQDMEAAEHSPSVLTPTPPFRSVPFRLRLRSVPLRSPTSDRVVKISGQLPIRCSDQADTSAGHQDGIMPPAARSTASDSNAVKLCECPRDESELPEICTSDSAVRQAFQPELCTPDSTVRQAVPTDPCTSDSVVRQAVQTDLCTSDPAVRQAVQSDLWTSDSAVRHAVQTDLCTSDSAVRQAVQFDLCTFDSAVRQAVQSDLSASDSAVRCTVDPTCRHSEQGDGLPKTAEPKLFAFHPGRDQLEAGAWRAKRQDPHPTLRVVRGL